MDRGLYSTDHELYRETVQRFVEHEVVPKQSEWDAQRLIGRDTWLAAGRQGLVGLSGPERFGGLGLTDYRFRNVIHEELAKVGAAALTSSLSLQDDIVMPYFVSLATAEQQQRWLSGICGGELIAAIAMTEPSTGSDLRAIKTSGRRVPTGWMVNGAKTFITSGIQADVVVVVARTDPAAGRDGFTLFVVEDGMPGFTRGRKLDKVGLAAQDTAELFFDDVLVPADNVLGAVGGAFNELMRNLPLERLSIAAAAIASADAALAWTLDYVQQRTAFGQPIADFQNTRFVLAEVSTELDVTRAYVDRAVVAVGEGRLSAVEAAKAKWWATDVQGRVIDRLLQLFGGYGYMLEFPIAQAWKDARVQRIFGGTNEIMKEIIGRDLVGRR
ncbi:MAG TPA: acyl-CoA dehydrogenase family protein [Mycobacteriales bacterium]|jgi:long-chain-acyl-CoA dehydrogenase|nr:acyl-CoA dehydrogenase family protein [Mycobacteriales bacterium]